jgi:hypothetical protein
MEEYYVMSLIVHISIVCLLLYIIKGTNLAISATMYD